MTHYSYAGPSNHHAGPSTRRAGPSTRHAGPSTYHASSSTHYAGPSTYHTGPSTRHAGPSAGPNSYRNSNNYAANTNHYGSNAGYYDTYTNTDFDGWSGFNKGKRDSDPKPRKSKRVELPSAAHTSHYGTDTGHYDYSDASTDYSGTSTDDYIASTWYNGTATRNNGTGNGWSGLNKGKRATDPPLDPLSAQLAPKPRKFKPGELLSVETAPHADAARSDVHPLATDEGRSRWAAVDQKKWREDEEFDPWKGHGRGACRERDLLWFVRKTPDEYLVEAHRARQRMIREGRDPIPGPVPEPKYIRAVWLANPEMRERAGIFAPDDGWTHTLVPLEPDGELDLRKVQQAWNLDHIFVWDQHRTEVFIPATLDRLSALAVYNLRVNGDQIYFLEYPSRQDLKVRETRKWVRERVRDPRWWVRVFLWLFMLLALVIVCAGWGAQVGEVARTVGRMLDLGRVLPAEAGFGGKSGLGDGWWRGMGW